MIYIAPEFSECPSFGKGFNIEAKECIACKLELPEEYEMCKKLTEQQSNTKEKTKVSDTSYYSFKAGSRSDAIYQYLVERYLTKSGDVKIDEVAKFLVETFSITFAAAKSTVISYVKEWAAGKSAYVNRNFDFVVAIDTVTGFIDFKPKENVIWQKE